MKNLRAYWFLLLFLGVGTFLCASAPKGKQETLPRPKLVVGIVIDQMRWDYLYRYYDRYGNGGFRRMLREGVSCENTMLVHLPSYTAVGHATLYTGTTPAIHGIAANDFTDRQSGHSMYCVSDREVETVGSASGAGHMSPRNLLASTITDELRIASNFRSKVIGISLKDRASILPAGHAANAAYWYDSSNGAFITSTFYMKELPQWLKNFNAKDRPRALMHGLWNTLYPAETYTASTPDDSPYESAYLRGMRPTLPVDMDTLFARRGYDIVKSLPAGNTLTLEMARAAIEGESLGQDDQTDFLAISCSSTDYIGHQFGPNSVEIEDTYLRLDKDLSDFFQYLDRAIGKGQYTVFLSADHAATNNLSFQQDHGLTVDGFHIPAAEKALRDTLQSRYGNPKLIKGISNYQVVLDYEAIRQAGLDKEDVKQTLILALEKQPRVAYAIDQEKVDIAPLPDPIKEKVRNGYNRRRSGEIQILVDPGCHEVWSGSPYRGATHGTWNTADTHIPLLFMGWGIQPIGRLFREIRMTDLAPTIATLLRIQMPNGCIGNVIPEVLQK